MSHDGLKDGIARKRRKLMEPPDGFTKRKPVDAPKPNIPVPKFTSAFNEASHAQITAKRLVCKPKPALALSQDVIYKGNFRQLTIPSLPLPPKDKERPSAPLLRAIAPPDPRAVAIRETPSGTIPVLQLRPAPLRPPLPNVIPLKHGVPLKDLPLPPAFPLQPETTTDKPMRTISTTEIALATDLSTESGTAELAHIFLHDQHPELVASSTGELPEWNIGMSPQKGSKFIKGKGKEAKFVRGGLAARASELMTRSRTSLALWQKDIEHQLASSSPNYFKAHLRLRIIKISSPPMGASSGSPRKRSFSASISASPGVAFCQVVSVEHGLLARTTYNAMERKQYLVVFSFPTTAPPRFKGKDSIYVRNPEDFVVGHEVYVWEPWLEVSLASQLLNSFDGVSSVNIEPELSVLRAAPFPALPSTCPQPSPPVQPIEHELNLVNHALFISRFVILPRTKEFTDLENSE